MTGVRRFKKEPCPECSRSHAERDAACSSRDYWRQNYQAEANENCHLRDLFGIEPTDPDETLSAEAVREWLRRRALLCRRCHRALPDTSTNPNPNTGCPECGRPEKK